MTSTLVPDQHPPNGNHASHANADELFADDPEGPPRTKRRPSVSCVIPTLNEERNIAWVMQRIPQWVDEVLLVDGHSTDRTVEIAQAIRPDLVVVRELGRGKGAALCTGFARATGDYIVIIDADGSMDPAEIDYYVTVLDQGYHFAKGSRFLRGGGSVDLTRIRTFGNWALKSVVNAMWGVSFTDLCYGFLAFHRDRLAMLAPAAPGFEIEAELIARALNARLRIAEVPSVELVRHYGESNLHAWRDGRRILRTVVSERLRRRTRTAVDTDQRRFGRNLRARVVDTFDHVALRTLPRQRADQAGTAALAVSMSVWAESLTHRHRHSERVPGYHLRLFGDEGER
jgi:glycosyltransferase involved in cell wall biosynthesis